VSPAGAAEPAVLAAEVGPEVGKVQTVAGPTYCDGTGTPEPQSRSVRSLAVDSSGVLYFETGPPTRPVVIKVTTDGQVRPLGVGTLQAPVKQVKLPSTETAPSSRMVPDGQGGVLIAFQDSVVQFTERQLVPVAGRAGLAAGAGLPGPEGDGGPALEAAFTAISGMAADENGNLYIADRLGSAGSAVRIRFVNRGAGPVTFFPAGAQALTVPPGGIATVAGVAGPQSTGDEGPARLAVFQGEPSSLAVSGTRLYVASAGLAAGVEEARVRVVNLGAEAVTAHGRTVAVGGVDTVAGGMRTGYDGDGGPARGSAIARAPGLAVDGEGSLLLADPEHHRVRQVDAAGIITTYAGGGSAAGDQGGFNGNDRPALGALLNRPVDVEVGAAGRVYVADERNGQVRFVDAAGVIHAAPGSNFAPAWTCLPDAPARFGSPRSLARDDNGDVYFITSSAFFTGALLRRLSPSGTVSTITGGGPGLSSPAGLGKITAVAVHPQGGLYLMEAGSGQVRFLNTTPRPARTLGVSVAPGALVTVVGSDPTDRGGTPASVRLSGQGSLAADDRGTLFVADSGTRRVLQVDAEGTVSTLASADEPERYACCKSPSGLAVDSAGNLYLSDRAGYRVWFVNRGPKAVTVHGQLVPSGATKAVAGNGSPGVGGDGGPATSGQLQGPAGLAVDPFGNLFIAEPQAHAVRQVDAAGTITTVIGSGQFDFNGDGLRAQLTSLNTPTDVVVDGCGNVLVADEADYRVRRVFLRATCVAQQAGPEQDPSRRRVLLPMALAALGFLGLASAWMTRRTRRRRSAAATANRNEASRLQGFVRKRR